jgi:dTDP-4-amino-4,6-dideoxygalactose transaminase
MQPVPFVDLKSQYQSIKEEIDDAISAVLQSSIYALGPEVAKFEEEFAAYHGAAHGVAVNSGTSALHVALLAAGIGQGHEVITVSMTFIATAAAVSYTGAVPVFVDVDPETFTMDVSQLEAKISSRTKAILPVHLYGQSADMDAINEIARRYGLTVIEDAAQAHGAEYAGRRVGTLGHMSAFSFYPGKNLGAYGEGGMVLTNDAGLAHKMRLLRDWGQERKYHHEFIAFNYRMDGLQGAILRVKLRHLDDWIALRRRNAGRYDELLHHGVTRSKGAVGRGHVFHIYGVFHEARDSLQKYLGEAGIQTGIHYPIPVHLQKPYRANAANWPLKLPVTEAIARQQLSLPMFAELSSEQIESVATAVNRWYAMSF